MNLDEALQMIGTGITQRCAVLYLSFAAFAEGFITAGAFFLTPHESCDFSVPWSDASFFAKFLFGMILGSFIMGATSDVSGRRYTLTLSTSMSFICCIAVSGTPSLFGLELALLCLGFSVAGIHAGCRVLLFEFIPMNSRGSYTIMMDLFSILGLLSALVWGRYLLSAESYIWSFPLLRHWRLLFFLASLLCLLGSFLIRLTFYSPRQMLAHQRIVGTLVLLKRVFALNQCKHESSFPVTYITPFTKVETRVYHRVQWSSYLIFSGRCVGSYIVDIFRCPHTILTGFFFIFKFAMFDSIVIINGLVSQRLMLGYHGNLSIGQPVNETITKQLCNFVEPSLYLENIYLALVAIFAVCLLVVLIDLCPRNIIILISTSMCGICAIVLAYEQRFGFDIVGVIMFIFFHTALVVTMNVVILETYATKYRSTAYGLCKMIAHITSFGLVQTAEISLFQAFGIISYLMFVLSIFSPILRNTNRQPIEE